MWSIEISKWKWGVENWVKQSKFLLVGKKFRRRVS